VTFVKIDLDYLNNKASAKAFYIHETTKDKLIKEFTI
jgi:hypothetical protein